MSKISKNIRQLRTRKGMTQDQLAEKLFVTRQAVSSWENGRTQPDIYMLGKLRVIFDVSIEELLYGEKRNTKLETEKPDYTSSLVTVFSVLGAILTGAGLVMIFVFSWEKLPDAVKGVLCFLPMILGQAAGIFVLMKKKGRKAWHEGGSVLWVTGVIASTVLCYAFFEFSVDEAVAYAVMTMMVLPVMLIMRAVAVLPVFYAVGTMTGISLGDYNIMSVYTSNSVQQLMSVLFLLFTVGTGCMFARSVIKKEGTSISASVAEWLSAVAFPVISTIYVSYNNGPHIWIYWLSSTVLVYYIISQRMREKLSSFGVLGLAGTTILCGYYGVAFDFSESYSIKAEDAAVIAAAVILVACALVFVKGKFARKTQLASAVIFFITQTVYVFKPDFMLTFFSLAVFVIMIAEGAMSKKLIPMNMGFIGFLWLVMFWIIESGLDNLWKGLILVACGGVLLGVNLAIVKSKRKASAEARGCHNE